LEILFTILIRGIKKINTEKVVSKLKYTQLLLSTKGFFDNLTLFALRSSFFLVERNFKIIRLWFYY